MPERPFLTARWHALLMLNYEVDPGVLMPHVPAGTVLDRHEGGAYASVVAFRFSRTRLLGVSVPGHRDFEELNLRFYVRRDGPEGVRRGVVFIREVVPRLAIAFVARALYNEPYIALPMRSAVAGTPPEVRYAWRAGAGWQSLSARAQAPGSVPGEGSHEAFITEHYWGYGRRRDGRTAEYRVAHPRWTVWPAEALRIEADFGRLYPPALAAMLKRPVSAFIAGGSDVSVSWPRRLPHDRR